VSRLFLLDGYNLLFSFTSSNHPLATQRSEIIRLFQKECSLSKIEGALVFDGRVQRGEESGRNYHAPLEVIYTPKGSTADTYILELIEFSKSPNQLIVVSNDRTLLTKARSLGAQTMTNAEFLRKLLRPHKKTEKEKPSIIESKHNIERLLHIFEKKLREEDL